MPIQKAQKADVFLPSSFRPVGLLPVFGKTSEKLVLDRLINEVSFRMSPNEFGFVRGKSTLDAIRELLAWHEGSTKKHTLIV